MKPAFGGKAAITEYMRLPDKAAQARGLALSMRDDRRFAALETLPSDELRDAYTEQVSVVDDGSITIAGEKVFGPNVSDIERKYEGLKRILDADYLEDIKAVLVAHELSEKSQAVVSPYAAVAAGRSWDGLYGKWFEIRRPRGSQRHYQRTTGLLRDKFDEQRDLVGKPISPKEAQQWVNGLATNVNNKTLRAHVQRAATMYRYAAKDASGEFAGIANPFLDLVVTGGKPTIKPEGKAFTAAQARLILDTAARPPRFGDTKNKKRAEQTLWMLRLLAYTGALPREISQLQGGDVIEEGGIKAFWIRDTDAANPRELHSEKSLKSEESKRLIPLHTDVLEFYDHAQKFGKGEFIFGAFNFDKNGGRAAWLISQFGGFLRDVCKIEEGGKRLRLYSFRNRFKNAMKELKPYPVPGQIDRALLGHAAVDINETYGDRPLDVMNHWMQQLKPLA